MIKQAHLAKEIAVTVLNKIGVLADMSKIVADHGINIEAAAGYVVDNEATVMLMTDDNLRAKEALQKKGYKNIQEKEAVVVDLENRPGVLKEITALLAGKEIDIKYLYGTACASGCPSRIVLATSDNEKALVTFRKKAW